MVFEALNEKLALEWAQFVSEHIIRNQLEDKNIVAGMKHYIKWPCYIVERIANEKNFLEKAKKVFLEKAENVTI